MKTLSFLTVYDGPVGFSNFLYEISSTPTSNTFALIVSPFLRVISSWENADRNPESVNKKIISFFMV
jgi:hypothetical protein